ncbi:MAG: hypothetical protein CVT92_01610 [Bacteroidetes bacterium HGW-Bacteroidetes-1]|jgi:hypothetical protein|nr:MAG: hypothetical protein CVT92_01610 [Bacteroidetes bacterium HGW-Bacteroidetes-1]
MNLLRLLIVSLIFATPLQAQKRRDVLPPDSSDFINIVKYLASEKTQGREVGTKGGYLAADFIALQMSENGLLPAGDFTTLLDGTKSRTYFQDFELWKYKTVSASLKFFQENEVQKTSSLLQHGINFDVLPCFSNIETKAELVFAGYGLISADSSYNDFDAVNVKNKIVLLLNGFPGHADTNSEAWKAYGKEFAKSGSKLFNKRKNAFNYGARAIIFVDTQTPHSIENLSNSIRSLRQIVFDISGSDNAIYPDFEYMLPSDSIVSCLPIFIIDSMAMSSLMVITNLNFAKLEKHITQTCRSASLYIPETIVALSIEVTKETIIARNVLGMIQGKDSTSTLVTGGHYDHLGIRGDSIYLGADDNASGAAGVLALSKKWIESQIQPTHNMIFACWDAEEKGLLGSNFFVNSGKKDKKEISLYVNMDMIARSEPQDIHKRRLSIGMRKADTLLFRTAIKYNALQNNYFELDLWDVTGHSGSDYTAFIESDIPVMSFFSGFHKDYHSPRDVNSKLDYLKMKRILRLVNDCLMDYSFK